MAKRRNSSAAYKAKVALEALRGDRRLAELAGRHKVHPHPITKWQRQAAEGRVLRSRKGRASRQRSTP